MTEYRNTVWNPQTMQIRAIGIESAGLSRFELVKERRRRGFRVEMLEFATRGEKVRSRVRH